MLLPAEAKARGFKNTLAFRRWCRRRGVAVVNDGRLQWVDRAQVDAALERIAAEGDAPASAEAAVSGDAPSAPLDPVALAVEALIFTRRTR